MDLGAKPKLTADQRIAQRWNRVQQRLAAKLSAQNGDDQNQNDLNATNDPDQNAASQSQTKAQIKKSRDSIDDVAQSITDNVNEIKLTAEIRAAHRRSKVETEYESRMFRLEQCIERGRELNANIDEEWTKLGNIKNPQALYKGIQDTKLKCKQLIMGYESTRKQFMGEFKKKSEHYVALLKSQENDVTEMIWRMHDSIRGIKEEYERQIIEVEKAFMKERREIIDENQKVLDKLLGQREKQEFMILERKIQSNATYHNNLEKVRREDQESYNKLKINLENHIQLLEQQLEEMRAMYQLNTEKLNYNFQVLKEREKENITTVDHLKRREKKLKESVTTIKEKFSAQDGKFKEEHKVLHDEYHRVSKQYKELQRKFKHFQSTDTLKYDQIVEMNRTEAVGILEHIMKCDQIIATQLLGMEWNSNEWEIPTTLNHELTDTLHNQFHTKSDGDFLFEATHPTVHSRDNNVVDGQTIAALTVNTGHNEDPPSASIHSEEDGNNAKSSNDSNGNVQSQNNKENGSLSSDHVIGGKDCSTLDSTKSTPTDTVTIAKMASQKYSTEEVMNVMKLLIAEAPFLISSTIKESLHCVPIDQQLLFQCDSILKSLGIEDIEDLEELVSLFIVDGDIAVEPFQTIQIVKKYVSDRDHTKTADIHATNFSVKHALTSASREKQERRKRKDQEYWKQLQRVFPEKKKKTWLMLEKYLVKFNKVLEQRKREAEKINKLQHENDQLRELLQQYLTSDANKELIIPPSLIIDAQQVQSEDVM